MTIFNRLSYKKYKSMKDAGELVNEEVYLPEAESVVNIAIDETLSTGETITATNNTGNNIQKGHMAIAIKQEVQSLDSCEGESSTNYLEDNNFGWALLVPYETESNANENIYMVRGRAYYGNYMEEITRNLTTKTNSIRRKFESDYSDGWYGYFAGYRWLRPINKTLWCGMLSGNNCCKFENNQMTAFSISTTNGLGYNCVCNYKQGTNTFYKYNESFTDRDENQVIFSSSYENFGLRTELGASIFIPSRNEIVFHYGDYLGLINIEGNTIKALTTQNTTLFALTDDEKYLITGNGIIDLTTVNWDSIKYIEGIGNMGNCMYYPQMQQLITINGTNVKIFNYTTEKGWFEISTGIDFSHYTRIRAVTTNRAQTLLSVTGEQNNPTNPELTEIYAMAGDKWLLVGSSQSNNKSILVKTLTDIKAGEEGNAVKASVDVSKVSFTGNYNDLTNTPVIPEAYELPKASTTTLGGIKVGEGLAISNTGVLSATTVAGTTDYTELTNKPSINDIELNGNKTLDQLGIQPKGNYLIEADLADYAKTSAIPTNVSQLTNDAGYITGVPDNYVTDEKLAEKNYVSNTELTEKDYATNAAVTTALAAKADTSSLATVATSGSYNDLNDKPTIPAAYELPTASTSTLGGVKIDGTTIVINDGVISASNGGGSGGTSNYAELTNKPTINNVELTGNKTSSDLNLTSNTNAVINNSLTLQEGNASLKVNFVETPDNKKVSEVQINGADYIDVLAKTHFLVAPTCGEQASYTDNQFMPKKSILSLIHMYSPKVHTDVVLTSSVKDDGDTTYPYLNTFNIADAEATDIPTVILSSDQVLSGNWSSISETVAGAVTIRTKVEIVAGTTIPQIILQKSTN